MSSKKAKKFLEGEIELSEFLEQRPSQDFGGATVQDLGEELPNDWVNLGDMNYVLHGGLQIKYNPRFNTFDVVEWVTPDAGISGYMLLSGLVELQDILRVPNGRLDNSTPLADVEFREDVIDRLTNSFYSLRDLTTNDLEEFADIIVEAVRDLVRYRGLADNVELSYEPEEFGLDEFPDSFSLSGDEEFLDVMADDLRDFGLDI